MDEERYQSASRGDHEDSRRLKCMALYNKEWIYEEVVPLRNEQRLDIENILSNK